MVAVASTMLALGTKAPEFSLPTWFQAGRSHLLLPMGEGAARDVYLASLPLRPAREAGTGQIREGLRGTGRDCSHFRKRHRRLSRRLTRNLKRMALEKDSTFRSAMTKARKLLRLTRRHARRTFSSLTAIGNWSTADSSMTAVPATASR